MDTLYTGTPVLVRASGEPWCAWPWNTASTGIAGQRLLETAGPQVGIDLPRLALDGPLDRRVVHQHHPARGADPRERRLELQRLVQGLLHELLDHDLAPRAERAPAEPAGEALHAGESDAVRLVGTPVQHVHARVAQDPAQLRRLPGLVVVIAEDGHGGDRRRAEHPGEAPRLLRVAGVGEVAAEGQHVRPLAEAVEQVPEGRAVRPAEVKVRDRGDAQPARGLRHGPNQAGPGGPSGDPRHNRPTGRGI
jgi:hypothetical protein